MAGAAVEPPGVENLPAHMLASKLPAGSAALDDDARFMATSLSPTPRLGVQELYLCFCSLS